MDILPDELIIEIFYYLFPFKDCDINEFKHYFLVNHRWNNLLNSYSLRKKILKKLNVYKYYSKIYKQDKIVSRLFTYHKIINLFCYTKLYLKCNYELIDIFGYFNFINLPVCKFRNYKCIENKCSESCYFKNHHLNKYIKHPIMRGFDNKNRLYLLFSYKDTETNKINYEFIYHRKVNNEIIVSYSGYINNTYIGSLSDNKLYYDYEFNRELNIFSYNYIRKLVENKKCTIPKYCSKTDSFKESNEGNITLYY